jgi:hypothetical protein
LALAIQFRIILAPVELEGLTWLEDKRNEFPRPLVCCSYWRWRFQSRAKAATTGIRAIIAKGDQVP